MDNAFVRMLQVVRVVGAVRVSCVRRLHRVNCWHKARQRERETNDYIAATLILFMEPLRVVGHDHGERITIAVRLFPTNNHIERLTFQSAGSRSPSVLDPGAVRTRSVEHFASSSTGRCPTPNQHEVNFFD